MCCMLWHVNEIKYWHEWCSYGIVFFRHWNVTRYNYFGVVFIVDIIDRLSHCRGSGSGSVDRTWSLSLLSLLLILLPPSSTRRVTLSVWFYRRWWELNQTVTMRMCLAPIAVLIRDWHKHRHQLVCITAINLFNLMKKQNHNFKVILTYITMY